ncbi:hypothetical protein [uncultured Mobiluncus sp.]|uniref:hypothetical protein n=1 Tax=uncultured Mobiluncus sp. TaxID=293425 RepID=UPI0028056F33|nr:hypothetical protein [uncultured Mobiluncus sp.]
MVDTDTDRQRADRQPRSTVSRNGGKTGAATASKTQSGTAGKTGKNRGKPRPPKYTEAQIRRNRLIALAIVILAIVGMVLMIREVATAFTRWQAAQAAEAKAYQIRMEERTFPAPQPCPDKSLEITLTHPSAVINVGAGDQAEMTLHNAGKTACTVIIDPAKVGMQIISGNQIIYNSTSCQPADAPTRQLLLDRGMTWKQNLSWDGLVHNADCSPASQAAVAGTYRLNAVWNGAVSGPETVFALQDPPPAPSTVPESSPETSHENPTKTVG